MQLTMVGTSSQFDSTPDLAMLPLSEVAKVVSISLIVRGRLILLVNPTLAANGLAESGECAKSRSEQASEATAQLPVELFKTMQKHATDLAPFAALIQK